MSFKTSCFYECIKEKDYQHYIEFRNEIIKELNEFLTKHRENLAVWCPNCAI